ncbi:metalloprotease PmbA [Metallibacterium sp.]|uniref:metalloprotease PmbA n=1 Tax=Metallibacterium sp. TaxID=2940281 RepID=UPI00260C9693|nr:metalloprotease PmbA [Metallibacterium sp.]
MPNAVIAAGDADSSPVAELDRLAAIAADVIARARGAGASAAEVSASVETGLNVSVRLGEVETVEHTRDRGFSLTVYFGQRKGSASTADLKSESIAATLEHACAIARYTEPDPAAGLADAALMASQFPDLDLWHPWPLSVDDAVELAQRCEAAGLAVAGIGNSEGASVGSGSALEVYANSHGFIGREHATQHSMSCALIAGNDEDGMQRDYWWDSARARDDLMDAVALGRRAAERTLARLGARPLATRTCKVLFTPDTARSLLGHLVGAVSGGALYRRASFLLDQLGQSLFPAHVNIIERPRLPRGPASAAFDAEGVATHEHPLIENGVLKRYVLGSYSARKLGLVSTANAGGVRNLILEPGALDFAQMLDAMGTGLVVTELMGQGVNTVTGDYSRGAAGYWVERGVIAHPVEEVTIASNLRAMFADIEAVGSDLDARGGLMTPSLLVREMTVAGAE